jgi:tetratricopeptide (TPR) repeat protein
MTVEVQGLANRAMSEDSKQRAAQLKDEGNAAFKGALAWAGAEQRRVRRLHELLIHLHTLASQPSPLPAKHYALAQQFYSKALEVDPTNAVLWGNRAFAAIRLEASVGWRRVVLPMWGRLAALELTTPRGAVQGLRIEQGSSRALRPATPSSPTHLRPAAALNLSQVQEFGGAIADASKALDLDPK